MREKKLNDYYKVKKFFESDFVLKFGKLYWFLCFVLIFVKIVMIKWKNWRLEIEEYIFYV